MHRLPLEGLTVVAVEQAAAAPFCTSRLADAGAHVIKIERPGGDFARGYDDTASGLASYFVWLNRGKDSHVVDLASAEGKETLSALLEKADVFVQNLKPGALDRLGFGPATLRKTHPRLIICSISGYGETGPMADRKAYDLLIQAESGLCSLTGTADEPTRVGISVVDTATGATAYCAVLEALIGRGVTGDGADIRVSMFDVMADWLTVPLLHHEAEKSPKRIGIAHPSIAPYGVFRTKKGSPIVIAIQNDRERAKLCAAFLEQPDAATDERYATNVGRVKNRAATDALVAAAFARRTAAEAEAALTRADAAFASLNDMAALSAHPHLRRITVVCGRPDVGKDFLKRLSISRTRCSIITLCCSGVLTGTKRIVGLVTASHIASASAASFLPRLTYGFTYCAGIKLCISRCRRSGHCESG